VKVKIIPEQKKASAIGGESRVLFVLYFFGDKIKTCVVFDFLLFVSPKEKKTNKKNFVMDETRDTIF
jgi:hypothetical protein